MRRRGGDIAVRDRAGAQRVGLALILALTLPGAAGAQSTIPLPTLWNSAGLIRVFEENGGALLSGIYRQGGNNAGTATIEILNDMNVTNAPTVNTIEARVTLLDASASVNGVTNFPRAGLEGFFYWDGTGTGSTTDETGHVSAGMSLDFNFSTQIPEVRYFVSKCTSPTCSTFTVLTTGAITQVAFFEPHRLRIEYDGTLFNFHLDDQPPVPFTPSDATRNAPRFPFKALRTRILLAAQQTALSTVLALFDNVSVNGQPYETFDARTLPRVTVMPGSGTFSSTQRADVVIAVETGGLALSSLRVLVDGADLSALVDGLVHGTLATGGITRRLPGFSPGGLLPGPHTVGVEATFANGQKARGYALWNVLPVIGP